MGWKQTSRWIFNKNTLKKTVCRYSQTLVTNIMPPQEHNTCSRHVLILLWAVLQIWFLLYVELTGAWGTDLGTVTLKKINKKKLWNIFFLSLFPYDSLVSSALTNAECFLIGAGVFNLQYKAWGNWWIEAISNACLTTLTRGCFSVKVCQIRVGQCSQELT